LPKLPTPRRRSLAGRWRVPTNRCARNKEPPPELLPDGAIEPLASRRTRTLPIQSAFDQSPSSGNVLVHREFASSLVGKKDRKIEPCRTLRRQKRCQCHRRTDTKVNSVFRRLNSGGVGSSPPANTTAKRQTESRELNVWPRFPDSPQTFLQTSSAASGQVIQQTRQHPQSATSRRRWLR